MQQTNATAYLIIQLGNRWTDILRLQPEQSVTIGRSSQCEVVVRDERASRKHAQISAVASGQDLPHGGWQVADLGSRNGTQVNGQAISEAILLQEGDVIEAGGCKMTFAQTLAKGFSRGNSMSASSAGFDSQATVGLQSLESPPPSQSAETIVRRLRSSQWSSEGLDPNLVAAAMGKTSLRSTKPRAGDMWSFFYRLIFDLVTCHSPEAAASVALERLLAELQLTSGGIVTFEPASQTSQPQVPAMVVLAARQATGNAYHRVGDFLVQSVVKDRQAVLARNVQDDSRLSMAGQSGRRETVSIIVAPLRRLVDGKQHVTGLLHVYSVGDERMLGEADLELAVGVADNLAIALSQQQANEQLVQDLDATRRKLDQLQEQLELSTEMIGSSAGIRKVQQAISRAGPTTATVLIRGESGVGKELVARAIHQTSQRASGPLVCLNCAALAPTLLESELFGHEKGAFTGATERKIGKFEAAHRGTLLLDEIGEMVPELQAKFLRALEGQPFERLGGNKPISTDVRVIAATNRDLEEAVAAKEFRADLYYRLRVIEIEVPPLRERLEDVPPLVEHFLKMLGHHAARRISGIEPEALELLCRHTWPGNVRELKNVIERAIVLGGGASIAVEDLSLPTKLGSAAAATPTPPGNSLPLDSSTVFEPITIAELEARHIIATLEYAENNKSKAAALLGIERSTLDRKLKRYQNDS
ncbi:MAG: sigma 54-interacting transcriptional regulator [Pirellulaceae bacterium]